MLRRMPIRLRVTLAFVVVMTIVLGAVGLFVFLRFRAELDSTINAGLRSRATDVAALVKEADSGPVELHGNLVGRADSFAEVLGSGGKVLDSTASIGRQSLLTTAELSRARRGPMFINRGPLPGLADESRLLAIPVPAAGGQSVVVVGTSTAPRGESLSDLLQLLLIGGPVALVLASIAAYGVAGAALRPVEAMRARAAEISTAEPGQRLPVPPTQDEIGRLGDTLNAMLERLGEALEHERAFVADASHELRTPLAILKTELELALGRGRSAGELEAALRSAAEETDRLTQLAEDLLTIAQTDRGELPVRIERIETAELLTDVGARFGRRALENGRELSQSDQSGLAVSGDRLRIEQALGNLVDNALRYGEGPVELAAIAQGELVELHVRDRGSGFAAEFRGRAFERFSRAEPDRGESGSGLGLAIVEAIARAHRGEAHIADRDGGGADAWLALPRS
jgi:signal transduction histidine kinase